MRRFAILCHSEFVDDIMDWQLVATEHPFAEVQKGEIYTVNDLVTEIKKGITTAPNAKPTGNTWSAELQRKNWPSRWVTMRGARVLIKIMNPGKADEHGVVVFAGNPKLEHLKVVPKGKEEYESIKKEVDAKKKKREEAASYKPTEEEIQREREQMKAKKVETQAVEEGFKQRILEIVESAGRYEADQIDRLRSALEGEETKSSTLDDLAGVAKDLTAPEQKQLAEDLIEKAHKTIVSDEIAKSFGDAYDDVVNGIDPMTGEPNIKDIRSVKPQVKKVLKSLKLTKEEALAILSADEIRKEAKKDIRDKYKDDIVRPKGNLEVTSLQGIIEVDWDAEPSADELIDKVLGNEKARLRAQLNSEFYSKVQSDALGVDRYNKTTLVKNLDKGSMESVNTVSDLFLDGNGLPPELVELIGIENTGRILAGAIAKKHGVKKAQEELEGIMETGALSAVMDSLESVNRREATIKDYEKQKGEGVLRAQTLGAAMARQQVQIGRELGQTLGSLQTLATLVDSLRDVESAQGDIIVDAGRSFDKIQGIMGKIGISEDAYTLDKNGDRYRLKIPYEKFGDLFNTQSGSKERNEKVAAIKAGELYDSEWLPSGTPKTSYTVYDKVGLDEKIAEWNSEGKADKAKGWEKFVNKKGQPGYSSLHKEGDVLYRKEGKTELFKAPQKMIQMALEQKRYVANLGAGTGKAQPLDAKILTPKGWVLMGDIREGDDVISVDGTATKVTGVYPQGKKQIFRVEFSDGSSTECCEEHLWLTHTDADRKNIGRGYDRPMTVKNLNDISSSVIVRGDRKNHSIPMIQAVDFAHRDVDLHPYLMGVLLGDGCFKTDTVRVSNPEEDIIADVKNMLPEGVHLRFIGGVDYAITTGINGGKGKNPVCNAIRKYGLTNHRSPEKIIHEDYLFNSVENRLDLLRGLMDTDGGVEGSTCYFYTTSTGLVDGVRFLVNSLGGTVSVKTKNPTYTHNGEKRKGRMAYNVSVRLPGHINPFKLKRKADAVIPKTKYKPIRYIVGVVGVGVKEAQCISVAHESKLYVTDDFIVTHNTAGFLGLVQELKGSGKLKGFAFHTMPSRLRNEFFKDQEKFFPGLRVLELDRVKGGVEGKKKALSEAASGKYDMVISGHDSMKTTATPKQVKKEIEARLDRYFEEKGGGTPTTRERDSVRESNKEAWTREIVAEYDLPSAIASFSPQVVTVDEAHEAFKDLEQTESNRFRAIKMLADKAEYFVPATGTTVKNQIGELASLLHVTAPEKVKDPRQWAKQWEGINQAPTAFGELAFDAFRRSYDDIMLTEHLSIPNIKRTRKEDRIDLSDVQKDKVRQSEEIYHREKKMKGVALMRNDTYELTEEEGKVKTFDVNPASLRNEDGTPSVAAINHLKKMGVDPNEYSLVALGQKGAAQRRDSRHQKTLANGDWKTNTRFKKIADNFEKYQKEGRKQIVFYNRKDSLESLKAMFTEKYGYADNKEMLFIDGSVGMGRKGPGKGSDAQRDWKVKHFNQNPDAKVIFMSEAGMTGINMQAASATHWVERPNAHYKVLQGNARSDRTGQENEELAFHNYDTNTIMDDRRIDLLDKKRKLTEAIGETPDKRRELTSFIAEARRKLDERADSILKKAVPRLYINRTWLN